MKRSNAEPTNPAGNPAPSSLNISSTTSPRRAERIDPPSAVREGVVDEVAECLLEAGWVGFEQSPFDAATPASPAVPLSQERTGTAETTSSMLAL